ncbi:MAG: ABC transporter permease [Gammaproteobacteria bacterium]
MLQMRDALSLALGALAAQRRRSALIGLATAIGVAAVLLLTGLGDGARRYVVDEFSALGTNLLVVLPGRNETVGGPPPVMGETPRDLTLRDAEAVLRVPGVRRVVPIMVGSANVSVAAGLEREVTILGATHDMLEVRHLEMAEGRFLPPGDAAQAGSGCVLGPKLKQELFGSGRALGAWLRIGDRRCRVLGVLADTGVSLGNDFNDLALLPVASAQAVMNSDALFRILVETAEGDSATLADAVRRAIRMQHEGEDDVTIITQDSVVATFDRILSTLTAAVAAISAVSLLVAGILVMNVMLVAVAQRRAEIGLMKALGAHERDIRRLFLFESVLLTLLGALAGLAIGYAGTMCVRMLYPAFPAYVPWWGVLAGLATSVVCGLGFGVGPARRASRLDPVLAMSNRP